MAFYKEFTDRKTREDKRHDAEGRGGFQDEGARYGDARPPRAGGFGQPARSGDRPVRTGAPTGDRPPRAGGFGGQPPREGGFGQAPRGDRPPRAGGFGGQPPREGGFSQAPRGDRPPRSGASFGDRPPREGGFGQAPRGDRPPRSGASFGDRPPREGGFSQAPRGDRPPRAGASFGDRPPRDNNRFGGQPPRGGDRPVRTGAPFSARPPRAEGFNDRNPRSDEQYRFAPSGQQPYRSRGSDVAPRSYDEQRRERRDGPAPRDYNSFRYEAPERAPRPTYDAPELDQEEIVPNENLLSGRNPIREALKSGRDIEKLLVARGDLSGSAREIIAMAKEQRVPVQEVDRSRLDAITQNHQGMLAFASAYQYHTVEEMLALAETRGEAPFLVILDGITDPHNLGAIIRTAECAGAHGVIVQERRAVGLTPAAVKASAGAIEHIMVARVVNLVATLDMLKQKNIWIYAADMTGEDYTTVDFKGGAVIVIGAEGEGVSRLVLENADKRVALPVHGKIDSLNASVAAGILLYTVLRAR